MKDRLMNKILANMMISCTSGITLEQIDELQNWKDNAPDFNYKQPAYFELLSYDLSQYKPDPSLDEES